MSAEFADDIKVSTIEITNNTGLNLSDYNARLKHTGNGIFTITTVSDNIGALNLETPSGGIQINAEKSVDIVSNLNECSAINIIAENGGINNYAKNIFTSVGNEPFFPLNREKTGLSERLQNSKLLTRASNNRLNNLLSGPSPHILEFTGVNFNAADTIMVHLVDRNTDNEFNGNDPGMVLTTNDCGILIDATGDYGSVEISGDKVVTIDSEDGVTGILIGTKNTVPVNIGTTTNLTTVNGNMTVQGNLIVQGESVQNNVTIFTSEDPVFYLNSGTTGANTKDIGFVGDRGSSENVGFIWDESGKEWSAIGTTSTAVSNTTTISDYKPIKCGGMSVVTDTSNDTPTTCIVDVNGDVSISSSTKIVLNPANGNNVGVNTSTPNYDLDVNGTMNANQVYQGGFLLVPTGSVNAFAGSTAPGGWLICNGSSLLRSEYPALFAVIGTTYTFPDDGTHFNLPDMRSRMIVGYNSDDTPFNILNKQGGAQNKTLSVPEMPEHTHTHNCNATGSPSYSLSTYTGNNTMNTAVNTGPEPDLYASAVALTINPTGSGQQFSIMNPYITLNYIIKY
jgi:microcystin-dependent protein